MAAALREAREARLPYLPGLDGMRALAVIAVLVYHAQQRWLPGGFLGVEVFFVISGYLITALLLAEWRRKDSIDLTAFWLRRARRLLPALFLLLAVALVVAVRFLPNEVARLRHDALAAFGYVTNWYLIFGHQSYFVSSGRPSLLQHLWSLAVEEQFYVIWPVLLFFGLRFRRRYLFAAILLGAAASSAWMALLYRPGEDPSRLYYGTDTRVAGLLIGALLAFVWTPGGTRLLSRPQVLQLDGLGVAGLLVLTGFALRLDEFNPLLYRGGFALVAVATAAVIATVVEPSAHLGRVVLGGRVLRWTGLRSYGIYLWHWPVIMLTRPHLDIALDGLPLLALRLGVTVALAELSFRYIETPIRTGALGRAWRELREAQEPRRSQLNTRWAGAVGVLLGASAVVGADIALARPPAPPAYLALAAVHSEALPASLGPPAPLIVLDASPTPEPEEGHWALSPYVPRVTAVGDSVMLGAAADLRQTIPNLDIDAEVGRAPVAAIELLRSMKAAGKLGDVVVVQVGNNGPFSARQFDEMMQVLAGVRRVMFVNMSLPRAWEGPNNEMLAAAVKRYRNAELVDWHAVGAAHSELFWGDGIHLRPEGAAAYTALIAVPLYAERIGAYVMGVSSGVVTGGTS